MTDSLAPTAGPITSARIHPAIGVARVGNSPDGYFLGPEVPYRQPAPTGGYKDAEGRLKREAARFRVYGYDAGGQVVREITAAAGDEIRWQVHLANKKAAWYDFVVALDIAEAAAVRAPRRNAAIGGADRAKLVIDPGPRSIAGVSRSPVTFDTGTFLGTTVELGELRTDAAGRLIVLGGHGVSGSPMPGNPLTTFSNNVGWHDDTSDGPVHAEVIVDGKALPVDPAWVVVAPPNYSPDLVTPQTLEDVIYDAQSRWRGSATAQPSFARDILPLFCQLVDAQWVNAGFLAQFGWGAPNDLLRPELLARLARPEVEFQELRRHIFYLIRDAAATMRNDVQWPPIYGDAFGNYEQSPKVLFAYTATIHARLTAWMEGRFSADYDPTAPLLPSIDDVPVQEQPETLDRAALHFCMGGPFHPGCEMTWPMRQPALYRAPLRIRERPGDLPEADYGEAMTQDLVLSDDGPLSASGPGDITRWMAVPWQADTASCRSGYPTTILPADPYLPTFWPSRVPNQVLTEEDYRVVIDPAEPIDKRVEAFNTRLNWLRGLNLQASYLHQIATMVGHFGDLGVVERREWEPDTAAFPAVMYVESPPTLRLPGNLAGAARAARGAETVSEEFLRVRFGQPGRRV
ncbi:MAG TPA: LodA/GoxA family CTQ-dependent oxidase [Actinomycetota bacterium]|nr:LodA/GoxA family CTQ-dependent oxidase [Actinomycetota bacterium]